MSSRLYPERPFIGVSVAVFKEGKVLLAARIGTADAPIFSLPGGIVEIGETLEEAALRELMEEVGIKAEIVGFAGHVEVIERDTEGKVKRHFVVNAFSANWTEGEAVTGPEAPHIRWVDPRELGGITITKGLGSILQRAAVLIADTDH